MELANDDPSFELLLKLWTPNDGCLQFVTVWVESLDEEDVNSCRNLSLWKVAAQQPVVVCSYVYCAADD